MARDSPAFVDLDNRWRSGGKSFWGTVNWQEATRRPLHLWRTSDPIAPADRLTPPGRVIVRILDKMKYKNQFIASYKFSNLHIGGPRRPVFFDISTTRPELLDLDRNYDVIRKELLPRQGSSACCCILTRRASEGSASEPALARRRYVRFEGPLHAGLQAEGPVAGVSG